MKKKDADHPANVLPFNKEATRCRQESRPGEATAILTEIQALMELLALRVEDSPTLTAAERFEARQIFRHLWAEPLQAASQKAMILPATIHWPAVLENLTAGADNRLSHHLRNLTPHLRWKHHGTYGPHNCTPRFLENFALTELIGPEGLCRHPSATVGIFLIGPETYYPLHRHDTPECLYVLSGRGTWCLANGPTISLPPASAVFMPSGADHAFWSFQAPMAAIYICPGAIEARMAAR